jgi:hypothetical protein
MATILSMLNNVPQPPPHWTTEDNLNESSSICIDKYLNWHSEQIKQLSHADFDGFI